MSEEEAESMLLELKEKAELMLDLAYSSVIYDNREIAEEVYELEDYIDNLHYELQKLAIEDSNKGELETNEALAIIQLGNSSEVIADAAREIADVELRDVELHPIIKESLLETEEVILRAIVENQSILNGKKLGEIELATNTGMWVFAIRRGKKWIYGPDKNTTIKEGDVLFVKGPKEGKEHFISITSGKEREI
ncbi:MAG: PhoU family transcriptional regulator [Thermoplasmata archaeon]|nr:PhoU family transcriptional regulator [Thermoplasmata archaeon]